MSLRPPPFVLRFVARRLEAEQARLHADAERSQDALLRKILRLARDTELGRMLGIADVRDSADFAARIPARTAKDFLSLWDRAARENPPGVVHPKKLEYVALSGGTSGIDKLIPFPEEHFATMRRFTNHAFFHAFHALDDYTLLSSNILVTSGPPIREVLPSGVTVGYGSGLASVKSPRFARSVIRPTPEVLGIPGWQEKIAGMVDESLDLDIRALTGMPNAVVPLLEQLLATARARGRKAEVATDVWPNLRLYAFSGSSLVPWESRIRALLGERVHTFEVYSSSEAPIAFQHRIGEPGLLVDLSATYLEFEPVDGPKLPRKRIHEVEVGVTYDIVVTSFAGCIAYKLGDRVEFLSTDPYVLRFAGRDREEMNLVAEHLALPGLRTALHDTAAEHGVRVHQFFVCPSKPADEGSVTYEWVVEFDGAEPADRGAFVASLDRRVADGSKIYAAARRNDSLLAMPLVTVLPKGTIESYVLDRLAFGQSKVVHTYADRRVPDALLAYAAERPPGALHG